MSNKKVHEQQINEAGEDVVPANTVTYFLPYEGRVLDALDVADVEKQISKEKDIEVGDGNS